MTREEFESLVERLEREAAADPARYRSKLAALALLGYGYVAAVVVALLAGVTLIVWLATASTAALLVLKKAGWALLVLVYMIVRAMWVRLEPPAGRRLTRREFPKLFEMVEAVRESASAPRVHEVLMTNDFNAAVVQHPRFGVFGGSRNYLLLGLPLMQALTPEEFKAVVAHEFGHLSGAHGRFGAWIYRLRTGWERLLEALRESQHWGSGLFTRFFAWYAPLFSAWSFVQARQQEYEADRVSVSAVGVGPASSALLRVNVQADFIDEKFWPAIFKRADTDPEPRVAPFTMLGLALRQQSPGFRAQQWLEKALSRRTGYEDTHPSLADRLAAMGVEPYVPAPLAANAADAFLGTRAAALQREMDEHWRSSVKSWWDERHRYVSETRARFAELERQAAARPLGLEELWELARCTEELRSADEALPLYAAVIARDPRHVGALWRHGHILLERDDARGIGQVMAAVGLDASLEQSACAAIAAFHRRNGRGAEARPFERRLHELAEQAELARRERSGVRSTDTLLEHGLSPDAVADVAAELARIGGVRRAWLVRKRVRHFPESPLYVLGILSDTPWWRLATQSGENELVQRIATECRLPGETLVFSLRTNRDFRRPLSRVRGSLIRVA